MDVFKLSALVVKYLRGNCDAQAQAKVEEWKAIKPANRNFIDDIHDSHLLGEKLKLYNSFDSNKAWGQFVITNKLKRNNTIYMQPLLKVASIIVLLISIGGVLYFLNTMREQPQQLTESSIQPGTSNAVLVVDNQSITLSDTVNVILEDKSELIASISNGQINYNNEVSSLLEMTVKVPIKSEYQFVLSDGTKVWMNAGSKVTFAHPFKGNTRSIKAEGEVYLEVAKDATRPFVVELPNNNSIEVLGTQFNVKAYPEEHLQKTVLVEGSVLWKSNNGKERLMEPGQLLLASNLDNGIEVKVVDVYPYIAWKNGYFAYENERLEDIMTSLSRWYGVTVTYQDEVIKDLHFSMDVKRYEHLNDILKMLEVTEKIYFTINGSEIIINKHN
ncbi:FecR family protein [Carboxylicivirga sediminis]|uniref:FecR family protein n=1 Tax=Carboxylicivirga sediminis TaxID=2006564 RepID=A0A941EZC7_9BACT|nr:FecR family protein [Carboxylicivirga sediminis]MBR8534281.1 FecR family protein [Carboxylicivirga sediminis]